MKSLKRFPFPVDATTIGHVSDVLGQFKLNDIKTRITEVATELDKIQNNHQPGTVLPLYILTNAF